MNTGRNAFSSSCETSWLSGRMCMAITNCDHMQPVKPSSCPSKKKFNNITVSFWGIIKKSKKWGRNSGRSNRGSQSRLRLFDLDLRPALLTIDLHIRVRRMLSTMLCTYMSSVSVYSVWTILIVILDYISAYLCLYLGVFSKQSRYTPWRRLGGEEL
jgi:hypothetical protein